MATSKKKTVTKKAEKPLQKEVIEPVKEPKEIKIEEPSPEVIAEQLKTLEAAHKKEVEVSSKFKVGDMVLVSKDAEADLEGFTLFPQYKKYMYTVEAYDEKLGVYSLRKLNLLLRLKEKDIVAPHEKSDSQLIRRQF